MGQAKGEEIQGSGTNSRLIPTRRAGKPVLSLSTEWASQAGSRHRLFRGGANGLPFHLSGFELGVGDEQMPNQSLE